MLLSTYLLGGLAAAGSVFCQVTDPGSPELSSTVIPGRYILQLDKSTPPNRFARTADYSVRQEFNDDTLFHGVSIQVSEEVGTDELKEKLKSTPGVLKIWPVQRLQLSMLGATNSNESTQGVVNKRDIPTLPKIEGPPELLSPLKMTGVDKLHAEGIKGKGIKIGILDLGIDYRHPSLGGGFGPGYKVAGGYSFVGDNLKDEPELSDDPLVTCIGGGHGTHTAGIIGMQDPEESGFGLVGVAPEASIYGYRVFDCNGATTTEILIMALEKATADGVHLTSNSWSYVVPNAESPFAEVVSNLYKKGIATVASAGNNGIFGLHNPGTPSSLNETISVGSISNTYYPLSYSVEDNSESNFTYGSIYPLDFPNGLDVWIIGSGDVSTCDTTAWAEAASKVGSNTQNTIAIVVGVNCKYPYPTIYGFNKTLLLTTDTGNVFAEDFTLWPSDYPITEVQMSVKDGLKLMENYKNAGGYGKYKLFFNNSKPLSIKQAATGGLMSNFSTLGTLWDEITVKPQVSAPGGNILATWVLGQPNIVRGYAIISGTSMSAPFAAGCYALVKSVFPEMSIKDITELLQATSGPVKSLLYPDILSTTVHQGSGLINPFNAIKFNTMISPAQLSLGDTDSLSPQLIKITNRDKSTKTYTLGHQGAGYTEYFPYTPELIPEPGSRSRFGLPQLAIYAMANFSKTELVIAPGGSETVEVTFSPPNNPRVNKDPLYSGYITITSDDQKFNVPYAGLPYSRQRAEYFDRGNTESVLPSLKVRQTVLKNGTYVVQYNAGLQEYNITELAGLYPIMLPFITWQASEMIRIDVVSASTSLVPDLYGFDQSVTYPYQAPQLAPSSSLFNHESFGNVYKANYTVPSKSIMDWNGDIVSDNGTTFQPAAGDYRFFASVLRFNSDPNEISSYDKWLGPVMRIV